ncbi:hypothetical protein MMC07_001590 [Pseudocyphellaria aurata]|nr:hypothetical protein [Pseudocyphellaria aurata]
MAQALPDISDSFVDLERHRLRLEENVAKLQKSLQHWQTWEAEYEGFKEELLELKEDCTDAELSYTGAQYDGTLLDDKEIESLLEDNKGHTRSRSHVVGLLDRRIDYVQRNINTIGVSLRNAEEKAAASLVLSQPDIRNEDGLPLTEIREDLDDEGNVISSSITTPNETAPHIVEALQKAGVSGLPETKVSHDGQNKASGEKIAIRQATKNEKTNPEATTSKPSNINKLGSIGGHQHVDLQPADKPAMQRKKSVSFAEGTKKEDATTTRRQGLVLRPRQNGPGPRTTDSSASSPKSTTLMFSGVSKGANNMGENVNTGKGFGLEPRRNSEAPKADVFSAIVPTGESPKDAELRRQMIEYNMREIGSVVAEIDIEEEGSDSWSEGLKDEDDDEEDDGEEENSDYGEEEDDSQPDGSTDEDEDAFGRSKRRVLDNKYVKEMLALEKKLNSMTMRNTGPGSSRSKSAKVDVKDDQNNDAHQDAKVPKEVRFASKLDIQDQSSPASSQTLDSHSGSSGIRPLQAPITERAPSGEPRVPQSTKRVSRFKNARSGSSAEDSKVNSPAATSPGTGLKAPTSSADAVKGDRTTKNTPAVTPVPSSSPQPPSGAHASTIIERPYSSTSSTAPTEPDNLDSALLQQQVTTEYHNMRNRMIQRQGGFLASAAEEANDGRVELDEEGGEKKVSRFKAAKLRMR